jgi:hypothetical protein
MLSHESIDKFVRHQNVERYRRLLENVMDENRRDHLVKLLAKAKQKQKDAEDPEYPLLKATTGSGGRSAPSLPSRRLGKY